MKNSLTIRNFLTEQREALKLKEVLVSDLSLKNKIKVPDISRPGLALVGFHDYFGWQRLQVLGKTEIAYLDKLSETQRTRRIKEFMKYKIPGVIFSRNMKIPELFKKQAEQNNIALLKSTMTTTRLVGNLTTYLEEKFAPSKIVHGTLIDVHGVGVLVLGGSGVGKSESALELVERGHRLVVDDIVTITKKSGRFLTGQGSGFIRHHMEIRGIGIIDVRSIYGASAVRNQKRIGFVVSLEEWDHSKEYERLGLEEKNYTILGVALPHFVIPVKPGRNIAVLIELAASTQRLKRMGHNPVQEIERKMLEIMSKGGNPMDGSF